MRGLVYPPFAGPAAIAAPLLAVPEAQEEVLSELAGGRAPADESAVAGPPVLEPDTGPSEIGGALMWAPEAPIAGNAPAGEAPSFAEPVAAQDDATDDMTDAGGRVVEQPITGAPLSAADMEVDVPAAGAKAVYGSQLSVDGWPGREEKAALAEALSEPTIPGIWAPAATTVADLSSADAADVSSPATADLLPDGAAAAVAGALERVARRLRSGEIALVGAEPVPATDEAALAVALAALLRGSER